MQELLNPLTLPNSHTPEKVWLNLASLAHLEIVSSDQVLPIRSVEATSNAKDWINLPAGEQTILYRFQEPQDIQEIQVLFREEEQARTQEFLLRWLPAGGNHYHEIVRQQFNFSPPFTTEEKENYTVDLSGVSGLALTIIPDISKSTGCESRVQLQLR